MKIEDELYSEIFSAPDPVCAALKFAMASNYIDFARISDLDESAVSYVLASANRAEVPPEILKSLKTELKGAKSLLYLHDNCGEIVLDKILIRTIKKLYPEISVTSVVRGSAIINDVTRADAEYIGLSGYAEVIDNGTNVPGTPLNEVTKELKGLLKSSDIVLSKGLGNLETLYACGYKIYYVFACKCEHIAKRFNFPLWAAAMVKEG